MFPVPPYLHTRNNQILEVTKALALLTFCACGNKATKAYEQRLHSKDTSVHSSHIGVQSLAFVHKPL